jgi:hypothetical protein
VHIIKDSGTTTRLQAREYSNKLMGLSTQEYFKKTNLLADDTPPAMKIKSTRGNLRICATKAKEILLKKINMSTKGSLRIITRVAKAGFAF